MTDYTTWANKTVYDKNNDKVGTIDTLYLDGEANEPTWATIKSSTLFGSKLHFAPVPMAEETDDGIRFNVTKDEIKNAPSVDAGNELSADDEAILYRHYAGEEASATTTDTGHDTSGPDTDEAMTRSEEQLHVGKENQQVGVVRLRKYIVTEDVHTTVPVSHEEVRVVREPITDANRDQAMSGADITEEEHEMTLNAERLVVAKETVPMERVKLEKTTVTDEQEVNETLRKEQISEEKDAA